MARERRQTITQQIMTDVIATQRGRSHDLSRRQYVRDCRRFVKFCRERFDARSFEECRPHIQAYSDHLQAEGYAASTIHTYISAVCAVFGEDLGSICKPIRYTADYVRGREPLCGGVKSDLGDPKWKPIVDFARAVGIRRDELMHLCGRDLVTDESGHLCVYVSRGKGGKPQWQRISDGSEKLVRRYFEKVPPNDRLFSREMFQNDLNFHSLRAACAKEYYENELRKIREDSGYAEGLESEIRARWAKCNRDRNGKPRRFREEEIRGWYTLRGKNRELAQQRGLPLRYNKLALLATSMLKLLHWRNDVTVASYILA